jgi:hypothetical protein
MWDSLFSFFYLVYIFSLGLQLVSTCWSSRSHRNVSQFGKFVSSRKNFFLTFNAPTVASSTSSRG